MVEAIREVRTGAGAVIEIPLQLSSVDKFPSRSFRSRMADFLLGVVAGTGLNIVEVLAAGMEKAYYWLDRDEGRYMKELRRVRH